MVAIINSDGHAVGYTIDPDRGMEDGGCCGGHHQTPQLMSILSSQQPPPCDQPYQGGLPPETKSRADLLIDFGKDFYTDCLQIARQRNSCYATADDPFRNFRLGGQYGIAIRMSDKVSRLLTLTHPLAAMDGGHESIEDTCRDLANYGMLLSALRADERGTK